MRPLGWNFAARPRRSPWLGLLLFLLGTAYVADLARDYRTLQTDVLRMEARFPQIGGSAGQVAAGRRPVNREEFVAARAVVQRFGTPWSMLFSAIESVQVEDVSLLSIEPDAGTGQVLITGEGRHYLAVLTYVAQLSVHPNLKRVHLTRHELREPAARRPVAFSIVAQWRRT